MKRRDFLGVLGASVAWPLTGRAQQLKMSRIGVLLYSTPEGDPNTKSFLRGLRELGYVDGQNIAIEYRFAEGKPERLPGLAAELVKLKPDVLFALGGDVAPFAAAATQTIPIAFSVSTDPVQSGLVDSLARPGRNTTGVTFLLDELAAKRLVLLKEAVPQVTRVAVLFNPDHIDNELREAKRAAETSGVKLHLAEVRDAGDLDRAFDVATQMGIDALYVVSSRQTVRNLERIVNFAARHRFPIVGGWGAWVQAGALISYGPNVDEMVRQSAAYVDKILKGMKPADLPVQQPTRFDLLINLKTAKALGVTLPPTLLARADEVIE